MNILIADDHEVVRLRMRLLMESHVDWKVCEAVDNGQAALEKTKEHKPDIAILDVSMPVLDGFAAAKVIKELYPNTAVLVCSAYDCQAFRNEARRLGLDGYVSKSDRTAILEAIEKVQRRRSRRLSRISNHHVQRMQPTEPSC